MQKSFKAYTTDALRVLLENTAIPASWLSKGDAGKVLEMRWLDAVGSTAGPDEEKTAEEIIDRIKGKLTLV